MRAHEYLSAIVQFNYQGILLLSVAQGNVVF